MKMLLVTVCAAVLAGCGAEVATTAVTSAAIKKQELDAAKQTKEMVDKKIDNATKAIQQRAEQQSNADK
ncbi:MAG TPA: hypothetical protein VK642_03890 [Burkholderiales bacterium]|nr:hypothetical protein [Burkholderiales bacterium]